MLDQLRLAEGARRPANLVSRLDFVTLKLYVAVVEEQSIAKAAERESIAPSAVSKRIADLEAALHVQLLLRQRKGVLMTEAGEALLHYARSILRDVIRLENELADHASGSRGVVRIAASESALLAFVPRVLATFNRRNPHIRIDLRTDVSPAVVRAVTEGQADLGIFYGATAVEGLRISPCYVDRLVIVVPMGHPLAHMKTVKFAELLDHEFIEQEANSVVQILLERTAAELGRRIATRIRVGSYDAACSMAQAGFGLAVVPDSFASRISSSSKMVIIPLSEPWAARQFNLCCRDARDISSQTRMLFKHFRDSIEGAIPDA